MFILVCISLVQLSKTHDEFRVKRKERSERGITGEEGDEEDQQVMRVHALAISDMNEGMVMGALI